MQLNHARYIKDAMTVLAVPSASCCLILVLAFEVSPPVDDLSQIEHLVACLIQRRMHVAWGGGAEASKARAIKESMQCQYGGALVYHSNNTKCRSSKVMKKGGYRSHDQNRVARQNVFMVPPTPVPGLACAYAHYHVSCLDL